MSVYVVVLGRTWNNLPNAGTNQYTFITTTKPISIANQLKFATHLGAANSIATVKAIFTASQRKNPITAVPAFLVSNGLAKPRANSAAGITTAKAP